MFNEYDNGAVSLNDHSVDIRMRHDIQITKQSLDERFNEGSVAMGKELVEDCIRKQIPADFRMACLSPFTSVDIKDSTRYQLPAILKDNYPGSGGAASPAGVHIQFEFDLKTGKINTIKTTDAKYQDVTDARESIADVKEGSLIIRDLGYFSSKVLQDIAIERKAYYISKLRPAIKIYTLQKQKYKELNLLKEYKDLKRTSQPVKELIVYIGDKHKVKTRLMLELMPEDQVKERMRKIRKEAKKKGRTVSKGYQLYASLGMFVTNVPEEWLAADHIRSLYRLRWQIELRFKCWKGLCRIHAIKKMKVHRFETYLYACLLYILINWEISMALVAGYRNTQQILLSVFKCFKALKQCRDLLRVALFTSSEKLVEYFEKIQRIDPRNLVLEKRKGHLSLEEIIALNIEPQ
jgi:hypothetical protein